MALVQGVLRQVGRRVVGQEYMVERLLISLLTGGHVLLEGVPGLAKTLTVRTLAETIDTSFQRIQFTPDLLPADVLGTQVFDQSTGGFSIKRGPIFANIILADEINRAPAKVQAALLEAMQEKQVTLGGQTFKLEEPFLVLATQNPIEQEGTYPLPEAQLDRFLFDIRVGYPGEDDEVDILRATTGRDRVDLTPVLDGEQTLALQRLTRTVVASEPALRYAAWDARRLSSLPPWRLRRAPSWLRRRPPRPAPCSGACGSRRRQSRIPAPRDPRS
jgi:MoxR-like ATPase